MRFGGTDFAKTKFSKPVVIIILPKSPIFIASLCKDVKIFHFFVESFWATFIDIWQLFTAHTGPNLRPLNAETATVNGP